MRDATPEDTAAFFVERLLERADWTSKKAIYFALIRTATKHAVKESSESVEDPVSEVRTLLEGLLESLPKKDGDQRCEQPEQAWMTPEFVTLLQQNPELVSARYTFYWKSTLWKTDFLRTLETQFWAYRHYAHGAGLGKMEFLRDLAEVWITAATTALVRYSGDDASSWRWTSQLLRRHAKLVDDDGLRSLPWGLLGNSQEKKSWTVDPNAD
jgi:hypothetical protein